ncbi:uncharacterized protein LOC107459062 isoform X1 [Arachis duranensis]|uniref:Pseudouridine synthase I TruA alpha/beta domain-containing protein n=3 Tax=Arachis TaxID=3817 RepID=A0A445EMW6_ARAHY|nr:uncharacterized protein LOC107459062 isoform X1 [Arachis duranensis]RYR76809.1 hypothetical protein Ahy_A01g001350 isoform A [Arachis hypogaea]RYR76810.1 hypothetical protein Ahy_A01g001350 isoform B [Arachis hypogaea]
MENSDTSLTSSSLPPPPPPPALVVTEEPEPKKQKMSTSTSDDEECITATGTKKRYKRRKIAIFFAYCGVGYQGMQKNPGAKTIEGDMEEALYVSGAVPEQDRGIAKRYDWARSARTDKGVSAVGQVVSGRFYIDPPGLVDRLNSNLPDQIRIFGYKRVTASFNAKKFCDRRRYVYLIPVFALDPSCHRDRETVLASLGSGNELVKCLECSERGRKVVGLVGNAKHNLTQEAMDVDSFRKDDKVNAGLTEDIDVSLSKGEGKCLNEESGHEDKVVVDNLNSKTEESSNEVKVLVDNVNSKTDLETMVPVQDADTPVNGGSVNTAIVEEEKVNGEDRPTKGSGFNYGEEEKERFNRILKYYVGTHNFHNFTTRTKAEDPAARRFIISFEAKTTVVVEGMEFVKCEIVGQSFMLHQIRKMVGLAVAIMRNCAPESLINKALQKDVNINVPTAPEVGLYLDECFFASYNQKWKDSHEELSMKAYEKEAEDFKMKYIYSHIASTEQKDGTVALWLHSLNHRNYPDLRLVDEEAITDNGKTEIKVEDKRTEKTEIGDERANKIESEVADTRAEIEVDDDKRTKIEVDNKQAETEVATE